MRLLTWNVGHQTRQKHLPAEPASALAALEPDVIVLTEYIESAHHDKFFAVLADCGLAYREVSDYVPRQNQVLVVARQRIELGPVVCDVGLSDATRPNWLHARVAGVDVVGLRRPMFKGVPRATRQYWSWVAENIQDLTARRAVLIGDFNESPTADVLAPVTNDGWRLVTPKQGWSFLSTAGGTYALDHALVSPVIQSATAAYHHELRDSPSTESRTFSFAGLTNSYSDHAVLSLDIRD